MTSKRRGGDSNFERTTNVSSPKATQVRRVPNGTPRSRDRSRIPKRPARAQFDPRKREPFPLAASRDSSPRPMPRLSAPDREVQDVGFGAAPAAPPAQAALFEQARGVGRVRPLVPADRSPRGLNRCRTAHFGGRTHHLFLLEQKRRRSTRCFSRLPIW